MTNFSKDEKVRVKVAPDRIGKVISEPKKMGSRIKYEILFPDGLVQELSEGAIEKVVAGSSSDNQHYGSVKTLRKVVTHNRVSGKLSDIFYSMRSTNTEFLAYQFKPVLNFLNSASNGLIIADEVGLGKTIEAGLIWTEISGRFDLDRLLVICPSILTEKWKEELENRFGLSPQIIGSSELSKLLRESHNQTSEGFVCIASFDALRPSKSWRYGDEKTDRGSDKLANELTDFGSQPSVIDLVIIDEAHYLRNQSSSNHRLGKLLRDVSEYVLMLTATPIQLRSRDLFNLLNILDPDSFDNPDVFAEVLRANAPLVSLSSKLRGGEINTAEFKDLIKKAKSHRYTENSRILKRLSEIHPSELRLDDIQTRIKLANQIERSNLLGAVVSRTRKRDIDQNRVERHVEPVAIVMNSSERKCYDLITRKVREFCKKKSIFEGFYLTQPQMQACSSMPAAINHWLDRSGIAESERQEEQRKADDEFFLTLFEDTETESIKERPPAALGEIKTDTLSAKLAEELSVEVNLENLRKEDSKFEELKNRLFAYWEINPEEKVVLFAHYLETIDYLNDRLSECGIRSVTLTGRSGANKKEVLDHFKQAGGPKIILASEVLTEGVDLQFCSTLINYDLPWNPMKLEQRIGRIDRIGQMKSKIFIWNFFYEQTIDQRIYDRLLSRLDVFRDTLGDMEAVLSEQIQDMTHQLLSHDLSKKEEEEKIKQAAERLEQTAIENQDVEAEVAELVAQNELVLQRAQDADRLKRFIDGRLLWTYARDILMELYPGGRLVEISQDPLTIKILLSTEARNELRKAAQSNRKLGKTRLIDAHEPITCVFDNNVQFQSSYEVISHKHPLIRFLSQEADLHESYPPISAEISKDMVSPIPTGIYLFTLQKWGSKGIKTTDRLVPCFAELHSNKILDQESSELLLNAAVNHGENWDKARIDVKPESWTAGMTVITEYLAKLSSEYTESLADENDDQLTFLKSGFDQKFRRELETLENTKQSLLRRGLDQYVRMTEGRIRRTKERHQQRTKRIENQKTLINSSEELIQGVINVR